MTEGEIGDGGLEEFQPKIRNIQILQCHLQLQGRCNILADFFPKLRFLADFLHISLRERAVKLQWAGGGAQRPVWGLHEPKKTGRSTFSGLYFCIYYLVYTLGKKCCSVGFYMLYNVHFPVIKLNWSALWCSVNNEYHQLDGGRYIGEEDMVGQIGEILFVGLWV